jgi:hypothetical protein
MPQEYLKWLVLIKLMPWIASFWRNFKYRINLPDWFYCLFAFSQGAVIWVFISEIFPNSVRSQGASLGSFTHWIMGGDYFLDLSHYV